MNAIAKKIRDARIKANMSEKELAKKSGVAASYIIQIESGKKVVKEDIAEKILSVFGQKMDFGNYYEEEEKVEVRAQKKKEVPKKTFYNVQPNEQWAGALANIIKKFPVYDLLSGKTVGEKQFAILDKKIDGIHWEKLIFLKVNDGDAKALKIEKDSIVWVMKSSDGNQKGIYFINWQNRNYIKLLKKTGKEIEIYLRGEKGERPIKVSEKEVKIIGKCMKVEIEL